MRAGAGPGAGAPYLVTSTRQARNESLPGHPLLEHRRDQRLEHPPGAAQPEVRHPRWAAAIVGSSGAKPLASSSAPSSAGSARRTPRALAPRLALDDVGRRLG